MFERSMVEFHCCSSSKSAISWLIQESKNTKHLHQIHTHIITKHFMQKDHDFLLKRLLFTCALSTVGSFCYANAIFRVIKNPNLSIFNIMIRAHTSSINRQCDVDSRCLMLYKVMGCNGITPDCLTLPFLVKNCTIRHDIGTGQSIHGQAIKFGLFNNVFVQNSLTSFYMSFGLTKYADKVFDEMSERDLVSWNSMVIGYLRCGHLDTALSLFRSMGKKNVISWNSIITGFVQGGRPKDALEFFCEMQSLGGDVVNVDKITIASVLTACGHLGSIDHGKWVHSYLKRNDLDCDVVIGTALVDMYGKCGCVERAYEVFNEMPNKDTLAWTAMISVFSSHGFVTKAFELLQNMEAGSVKPNHVTFVSLLSACAHSGQVEKGRRCFDLMRVNSIEPQTQHYACMIDILGRAGLFQEAEALIRSMPMEPDAYVCGALLGGCQMHGNVELGEKVAQYLIDLQPYNHAFYVNLCDIYAKAGRYDDLKKIRNLMEGRGIKKEVAGCSIIEVDGVVHEFSVRGSPGMETDQLAYFVDKLCNKMKTEDNLDSKIEEPLEP